MPWENGQVDCWVQKACGALPGNAWESLSAKAWRNVSSPAAFTRYGMSISCHSMGARSAHAGGALCLLCLQHCGDKNSRCRSEMNVQAAWKKGYTGKNVVVTILDDGIERNHPDLAPNYVSQTQKRARIFNHASH